jgi:hypothetical protein
MVRVEIEACNHRLQRMKVGHAVTDVLSKLNTFLDVDLDHCDTADTVNTHFIIIIIKLNRFKQLTCIWIM